MRCRCPFLTSQMCIAHLLLRPIANGFLSRLGKFHAKIGVWGALARPKPLFLRCEFENFAKLCSRPGHGGAVEFMFDVYYASMHVKRVL